MMMQHWRERGRFRRKEPNALSIKENEIIVRSWYKHILVHSFGKRSKWCLSVIIWDASWLTRQGENKLLRNRREGVYNVGEFEWVIPHSSPRDGGWGIKNCSWQSTYDSCHGPLWARLCSHFGVKEWGMMMWHNPQLCGKLNNDHDWQGRAS